MKKALALTLITALLLSALAVTISVSQALDFAHAKPSYEKITILSPENVTISKENVTFKFTVITSRVKLSHTSYCYTLDGSGEELFGAIWDDFLKVSERIISRVEITNDPMPYSPYGFYNPYTETTSECTATLPSLSYGNHNITIYRGFNFNHKQAIYSNLQTYYFTVLEPTLPEQETEPHSPSETDFFSHEPFPTAYSMGIVAAIVIVLLGATVYILKRKD